MTILDMHGREVAARPVVELDASRLQYLADVAALSFLLNAHLHGPDCRVSYSATIGGHDVTGPYVAFRASRRGVQQRTT